MRIGKSRKTQDDFDRITPGDRRPKESLGAPDRKMKRLLKLQLLLANSISNVNTNLNPKTDELKTKKSTRNEGFTSPAKVAKKQKILENYSVGVDAVNVQK
ncbi:hypothetical protein TNCV_3863791 [Trichonephila clavipes]|nr:hypothetical protein TNCV_3863791 [Trichonephila clavipes]